MVSFLRAQNQTGQCMCFLFVDPNWPKSNILQKVIFHLEAFVAKFMRIYEGYVIPFHPLSMSAKPADSGQILDGHGLLNDFVKATTYWDIRRNEVEGMVI